MRFLLLAVLATPLVAQSIVIQGARVVDGTGARARAVDVRVRGGAIVDVGRIRPAAGETVIKATGLVLAPGFIDMHNHSERGLSRELDAVSQVSQGITTILVGQDGGSALPIADWARERTGAPAALNVATMTGHATLRTKVMGQDFKRTAKPDEVRRMAELLEQSMKEGSYGLSSGLEYEVGSYSDTAEVIELARVAARFGGFYVSHLRDEADKTLESIAELIRIGREAKLPAQISHLKLGSVAVWGKTREAIRLVENARRQGQDVTADCYPYDAWSSTITVLVPDKQYDNPASVKKALDDAGGPGNVTITSCRAHPDYEGFTLEEIASKTNRSAVDVFIQIVRDGGAGVVGKTMTEADVRAIYKQPWVMVSSDGGIGMRHPRGAGTYPRILGRFVREEHLLTLEEAIRKMTSLPARRLKITNRGRIAPGMKADLVLFNPDTVIDKSTFKDPFALSAGIEKVWVNGQLVWNGGKTTGAHPGVVLTRP